MIRLFHELVPGLGEEGLQANEQVPAPAKEEVNSPIYGSSSPALVPGLCGYLLVFGSRFSALVLGLGVYSLVSGSSSSFLVPWLRGHSLVSGSSSPALVPRIGGDSLLPFRARRV